MDIKCCANYKMAAQSGLAGVLAARSCFEDEERSGRPLEHSRRFVVPRTGSPENGRCSIASLSLHGSASEVSKVLKRRMDCILWQPGSLHTVPYDDSSCADHKGPFCPLRNNADSEVV